VQAIVWALTIVSALAIIGLVLIQHGKGADVGAAFGSGSAGSLFGSSGAANFLSRTTAGLAAVFFIGCLLLTYLSVSGHHGKGVLDRIAPVAPATAPAADASAKPGAGAAPAPSQSTQKPAADALPPVSNTPAPSAAPAQSPAAAGQKDGAAKSQEIPK
jgi:preprotein translocase subunit SecG